MYHGLLPGQLTDKCTVIFWNTLKAWGWCVSYVDGVRKKVFFHLADRKIISRIQGEYLLLQPSKTVAEARTEIRAGTEILGTLIFCEDQSYKLLNWVFASQAVNLLQDRETMPQQEKPRRILPKEKELILDDTVPPVKIDRTEIRIKLPQPVFGKTHSRPVFVPPSTYPRKSPNAYYKRERVSEETWKKLESE